MFSDDIKAISFVHFSEETRMSKLTVTHPLQTLVPRICNYIASPQSIKSVSTEKQDCRNNTRFSYSLRHVKVHTDLFGCGRRGTQPQNDLMKPIDSSHRIPKTIVAELGGRFRRDS